MKAKSFSQFITEDHTDDAAQHQLYRRLQGLGLADSPLEGLEKMLVYKRWQWEKVDGDRTFAIELTRWEAESTYTRVGAARHQKKYPNVYYFSVTDLGAEPGKVRIIWHSAKDSVKEVQVAAEPEVIVRKIEKLFGERSAD